MQSSRGPGLWLSIVGAPLPPALANTRRWPWSWAVSRLWQDPPELCPACSPVRLRSQVDNPRRRSLSHKLRSKRGPGLSSEVKKKTETYLVLGSRRASLQVVHRPWGPSARPSLLSGNPDGPTHHGRRPGLSASSPDSQPTTSPEAPGLPGVPGMPWATPTDLHSGV